MGKAVRYISYALSLAFGVAVLLFFGKEYPYHIHFQEQNQLFQFTWDYFVSVVALPGGLADYVGRFLTQFFYYAWAGSSVIAVMLMLVQYLTYRVLCSKGLVAYALSFVPSVCLFIFLLDENAMLGAVVAVLLALVLIIITESVKNGGTRAVLMLVSVPLSYFLCGPLSLAYVLCGIGTLSDTDLGRPARIGFSVAAILLSLLCPVLSSAVFPYPFDRLLRGIHYYRYHHIISFWAFASSLTIVLLRLLTGLFRKESVRPLADTLTGLLLWIVCLGCAVKVCPRFADMGKEELMKYDFMVRMQQWNRILETAERKTPDRPLTVSCLNLALAMTDHLGNNMFDYYQNGPDGLLPSFTKDYTSPLSTAEAYYNIGMVNTAQRYYFEAQEAIPDFQKSARAYRRLAETNIINGDYDVARKYLCVLEHTIFYRKWARKTGELLWRDDLVADHPEYGRVRRERYHNHDFLFSESETDSMLGLLFVEDKDNSLAYNYLMAWVLLRKDLERFINCFNLVKHENGVPKGFQEAYLVWWLRHNSTYDGLPHYITRPVISRMDAFMKAAGDGASQEHLEKEFGDTYWYYYLYRYNQ